MLSIARHEVSEAFWRLYGAIQGDDDATDFWPAIAPAIARIDALLDDAALSPSLRGHLAMLLNPLRGIGDARRGDVAPTLMQLAQAMMSLGMDKEQEFSPGRLSNETYARILSAVLRADLAGPQLLNHSTATSDVVPYARVDLERVRIGIGRMIDEGLAEYEFSPRYGNEERFRIRNHDPIAYRIQELRESMAYSNNFAVPHASPLRSDYKDLIKGLGMKHQLAVDGHPTGSEVMVNVTDYGGDAEAFQRRVTAFAAELKTALAIPGAAADAHGIHFHGPIIGSAVQAGSPGATQHSRMSVRASVTMSDVRDAFASAKRALAETALDDDTREIIDAQIEGAEKQLAKDKPNPKALLPFVTTIGGALSAVGASGQGVEYLNKLYELLSALA